MAPEQNQLFIQVNMLGPQHTLVHCTSPFGGSPIPVPVDEWQHHAVRKSIESYASR